MLSIGEFSRVTGLTVKTLRLYDENGLLPPAVINPDTGYRFYSQANVERARVIQQLRALELPLETIANILGQTQDESDLVAVLEKHAAVIEEKLRNYTTIHRSLGAIIQAEKEATMLTDAAFDIQEKQVEAVLVAGIRGKASYDDSGRRFGLLGRAVGMGMAGKAMNLIYDTEYKEADADFESCFPIKKPIKAAGIDVHQLPAGRALTLIHRGPYDRIGESYGRLFEHLSARKLTATLPSREVYLKGPGMLFKGNPKNYLTEIQILIDG